jgi:hypothetical protein
LKLNFEIKNILLLNYSSTGWKRIELRWSYY